MVGADGGETPPLDRRMREVLEQCLERLTLVWRRVHRVELGDNEARLMAEFEAAKRACEVADAFLRNALEDKCAEVSGWMFWDRHHRGDAENTDPGAGNNWRATAWEIHPVTAIRVVPCPN